MDAKLPPGLAGKLILPFSLWLMKHTMLGNPLIRPWQELAAITEHFDMGECLFSSYYICRGMKPLIGTARRDPTEASNDNMIAAIAVDSAHRIAAE